MLLSQMTLQNVISSNKNVSFEAYKTASQTVATNTPTKLTFTAETYDTNSNYDTSTSRFTPTVAGKYLVFVQATVPNTASSQRFQVGIVKTGVGIHAGLNDTHTIHYMSVSCTAVVDMNGTTDWLEANFFHLVGSNLDVFSDGTAGYTWFTAILISPASADAPNTPKDITLATTDYPLKAGETVFRTFSAATSVPLRIACVEGEYEITIKSSRAVSVGNDGWSSLQPNNTTYASAFLTIHDRLFSSNTRDSWVAGESAIMLTEGRVTYARINVSTQTNAKAAQMKINGENLSSLYKKYERNVIWNDTSTLWSSMGTLILGYAQTGTVIISRIL